MRMYICVFVFFSKYAHLCHELFNNCGNNEFRFNFQT